jgi:hypothetical protein
LTSTSRRITVAEKPVEAPVKVGLAVEFLGYEVQEETFKPAETISLVTFWRVVGSDGASSGHPLGPVPEDAYGHELTIFAHVLDDGGHVVAQEDRLDAPAWSWHAGDVIAQVHRIQLERDLASGTYQLATGLYNTRDLTRLPILVSGEAVDDRLLLRPIEVTRR